MRKLELRAAQHSQLARWLLVAAILASFQTSSTVCSQTLGSANVQSETAPTELSDGQTLMLKAAKRNGLSAADLPPWHLKFSFKTFDQNGEIKDRGIFEEFWVGPSKHKIVYTNSTASHVEYTTEKGVMRSGDPGPGPNQIYFLTHDFLAPLPNQNVIPRLDVSVAQKEEDGHTVKCMNAAFKATVSVGKTPTTGMAHCVDAQSYALRSMIFTPGIHEDHFENPILFHEHFLPGDLRIMQKGVVAASAHLDLIEAIASVNEADFTPPADAVLIQPLQVPGGVVGSVFGTAIPRGTATGETRTPNRVMLASGVATGLLLKQVPPVYPPIAKAARIQGTVVLQGLIGKEGEIEELKVVSGHPMLQQSALDAVKQWMYKPYLLNGEPVQVLTTVNVVFQLDASPTPKRIAISSGVAQAMLIKRLQPVYPPDAKAAKVAGTVVLRATITTEGKVKDLQVVSGNPMLQPAALDAVQQWEYKPYLLNGNPVEVDTTINVVFSLGDPPAN